MLDTVSPLVNCDNIIAERGTVAQGHELTFHQGWWVERWELGLWGCGRKAGAPRCIYWYYPKLKGKGWRTVLPKPRPMTYHYVTLVKWFNLRVENRPHTEWLWELSSSIQSALFNRAHSSVSGAGLWNDLGTFCLLSHDREIKSRFLFSWQWLKQEDKGRALLLKWSKSLFNSSYLYPFCFDPADFVQQFSSLRITPWPCYPSTHRGSSSHSPLKSMRLPGMLIKSRLRVTVLYSNFKTATFHFNGQFFWASVLCQAWTLHWLGRWSGRNWGMSCGLSSDGKCGETQVWIKDWCPRQNEVRTLQRHKWWAMGTWAVTTGWWKALGRGTIADPKGLGVGEGGGEKFPLQTKVRFQLTFA